MEWFTLSVYAGDPEAALGSTARQMYIAGETDFGTAGQLGSIFNLCLSFVFMGLGFTSVPSHLIFAPCIFVGAGVCFMCAFVVGQSRSLAIVAFVLSNVCLTAAGLLPYGIFAFVVAIKYLFIISMMANGLAGVAALFLNT